MCVHLHTHSHYSLLDGLAKIDDLVAKALEYKMSALALTDHGVMYGAVEFYQKATKAGIKPIIGVEAYVAPNRLYNKRPKIDERPNHFILLAKDNDGYKNLMRLTSIAHTQGFYYKPRIDREVLQEYSKGIIATSACLQGEIAKAILAGKIDEAKARAARFVKMFGEDSFYFELQHHPTLEDQQIVNDALIDLSKEMGIGLIATNDIHYVEKDDAQAQDILVCVATGKLVSDTDRMNMTDIDVSMTSPDEMKEVFAHVPDALSNTERIAEMCNVELDLGNFYFPNYDLPKNKTAAELLTENCFIGAVSRLGRVEKDTDLSLEAARQLLTEDEVARLEYELDIILQKGYPAYFLIVADFINWAKSQGIITTTRGSAAGSFVSYAIGIIDVNPLTYNLPFERFLNPLRPSAPDIDMDIEDSRREEVLQYAIEKYGKDHVAQIITFGTMQARAAVRDVGRVLGFSYAFVDQVAKLIPPGAQGFPMTINRALDEAPDLKAMYTSDPRVTKLLDLSKKVEGCCRHASVHAAGVVISPTALTDFTPVQLDTEKTHVVTQYEMNSVESAGLVKIDFLGIRNLSILGRAVEVIKNTKGVDIDLEKIPLDDKKTFKMLARGDTFGVFQLSGGGMTKHLIDLKPNSVHDLMAMVALYRPGPMASIPEYIDCKRHPEKITYLDERMKDILEMSYGVITYQDDVLYIAIKLCGYDWKEADALRKAMGKKIPELMAEQKVKFIQGAIDNGMDKKKANELYKLIEPFASYGFNKSHATSYGMVAYMTAYLKANYPAEYMAALMTSESNDIEKIAAAIRECRRLGIEVLQPDINESLSVFTVISDTQIRFGLAAVKNIGTDVIKKIIEERKSNGEFETLEDFVTRLDDKHINKKVIENLGKAGAFDTFTERHVVLSHVEEILDYARTQKKIIATGQNSLFGGGEGGLEQGLRFSDVPAIPQSEMLAWEKEVLGIYLSDHPFERFEAELGDVIMSIEQIDEMKAHSTVLVGGIIADCKKIITKKGDQMAFVRLEDSVRSTEIIVFPKTYELNPLLWEEGTIVLVYGKISERDNDRNIIAEKVLDLGKQNVPKLKEALMKNNYNQRPEQQAAQSEPAVV